MGHEVRTHMKHYGQWTDEAGLDAAFGAANAKLTERGSRSKLIPWVEDVLSLG